MAIRVSRRTRIAGLTGVVLALGASAAPARPVALWGCHGPLGQPLGTAGLTVSQTGDGTTSADGACEAAGGLVATFDRPDPAGGSTAAWRADRPAQTTLQAVRVRRTLRAATGAGSGATQRYVVRADATPLQAVGLLDGVDSEATSVLPAGGDAVTAGVDCPRPAAQRCTATAPGAAAIDALVLDVDDATPPRGSVGGLRSPVRGVLTLEIDAVDDGVGLATAQAIVDGAPRAAVALDGRCVDLDDTTATPDVALTGCALRVTRVALRLDLSADAVGAHRLQVRLADAAGNQADIYDAEIAVAGPDPLLTPIVVLTIGDPKATPGLAGGASAPAPGTVPACPRPQLSMALDQQPVRVAHGRPVLRAGARYRFRGRLTCRIGTVRRAAARGTPVDVLNRVGTRTLGLTGATTRTGGRLTLILACRSSRTLIFRHRSATGTSQVRIPVIVARRAGR